MLLFIQSIIYMLKSDKNTKCNDIFSFICIMQLNLSKESSIEIFSTLSKMFKNCFAYDFKLRNRLNEIFETGAHLCI